MKIAFWFLLIVLTTPTWGQSYQEKVAASKALIGQPVQEHLFYTLDKQPINFQSLIGKPTVAYFFASWCSPCYEVLENLDKAIKSTPHSVNIIAISLDKDWEKLNRMLLKTGYSGQVWKSSDAKTVFRQRMFANFTASIPHIITVDELGILIEEGSKVKSVKQWAAVLQEEASLDEASRIR